MTQHNYGPHNQSVELIPSSAVRFIKERNRAELARDAALGHLAAAQESLDRAMVDPVTGLPNRNAFEEEYPRLFRNGPGGARIDELTIMVADLNGLKRINTAYGHAGGDRYLQAVATRLRRELRVHDHIWRTGGDELTLALPSRLTTQTSMKFANNSLKGRLKQAGYEAALEAGIDPQLYPGVSVGYAVYRDGDSPDALLHLADLSCESDKLEFYAGIMQETGKDLRR